ncbi:hypothetical protein LXL04_017359 [Taraxacum kok-saghyz]
MLAFVEDDNLLLRAIATDPFPFPTTEAFRHHLRSTAFARRPAIPLSNLQQSERDKLVSVPEAVATTEICTSEAFPVTMDGDLYIGRGSVHRTGV